MLNLLFCATLLLGAENSQPPPADTVLVCRAEFLPALQPWIAYRQEQGHRFVHLGKIESAQQIRQAIASLAQQGHLRNVVIVGDAAAGNRAGGASLVVPTNLPRSQVVHQYGSEPELASDAPFADINGDGIPELTVGRLPADTPEELSLLVRKIIGYEKLSDSGAWRQKINIVAGVGGFGGLVDSAVEMSTKQFLTKGIPSTYATTMTYGNWRSPYCPDPRYFQAVTKYRLEEGCLFWVYLGHGQPRELDRIVVPGGALPILHANDAAQLKLRPHWPIAVMLACYTGAFDRPQDCLAEELLRAEGGPIAVYAGSRVTMPYAMAVMGTEMLDVFFEEHPPTLGETIRLAKVRMLAASKSTDNAEVDASSAADANTDTESENDEVTSLGNRELLDALAAALSPNSDQLAEERKEHTLLFNLLGDPLLRLPHPLPVNVKVAGEPVPSGHLRVNGHCDLAGKCVLELVARRDTLRFSPPARSEFQPTEEGLQEMHSVYQLANDSVWNRIVFDHPGGDFEHNLAIPESCRGFCHVRATIAGKSSHAAGAADLYVRLPNRQTK